MIAWGWTVYYLISIQCHFHKMKEKEARKKKKPRNMRRRADKRTAVRRKKTAS